MSWEKTTLGEISTCIQPGPFGSQLHNSDYADMGTPIIMPKDMVDGRIAHNDLIYVPQEHVDRLKRHQVSEGNLMVARKGDVRKCVYISDNEEGWLTGSDCLKVALDEHRCNPRFIYYQLRSEYIGRWLEKVSIGSTMPSLNTGLLSSVELFLPPVSVQRRIADILSAYDDLIENNQKQIKLLEEAAQRLYREWFVELRFPGHETTPVVDGVPEGWKKGHAEDFFNITIGKTPPRSESKWFCKGTEGIPWVSISDMGGIGPCLIHTAEGLTQEAVDKHHVNVCPSGTVLLSFKLTVGRVAITSTPMCTNEAIAHFTIGNEKLRAYAYCYLKEFPYDTLGSTSSISKAVNSKIVKAMPFIMPDAAIINCFSQMCDSLLAKAQMLSLQNERLCEARDRLLPKLMSGEVEV